MAGLYSMDAGLKGLGQHSSIHRHQRENGIMKRLIAGVLLMVGLGTGTMFASDGYWHDRRDVRRDEVRIAHDRRELRRDRYYGNYQGARREERALRHEYRDLGRDRRDMYWDRR
jgi:hypothetical protein